MIHLKTTILQESKRPEWRLSLVRDVHGTTQWASLAVGWMNRKSEGMNFTNDLLRMFGFRIVVTKMESKR